MNKPIKENWTTGDISGFGFAFSLVLLGTMLSAYSDHPIFWLLAGTGPLVIGLTVIAFLRHLSNTRRERTPIRAARARARSATLKVMPHAGRTQNQNLRSADYTDFPFGA